jgi:hypothetical protein
MAVKQLISRSKDIATVDTVAGSHGITLAPTFQRGFVAHAIDGFRFTLNVVSANQMPTKIFRYRLVPSQVKASASEPPTAIELMGAFDGVCSPADLEDFPEDWPAQNARPPWYRLDYVDLIVRSRAIADDTYQAILGEVRHLVETLDLMDIQDAAPPVIIGTPLTTTVATSHGTDVLLVAASR